MLRDALRGVPGVQVKELMEDFENELWWSRDIEESLQEYLGTSQEAFKNLMTLVCKKAIKIETDLSRFDEVGESGREVSLLSFQCKSHKPSIFYHLEYLHEAR